MVLVEQLQGEYVREAVRDIALRDLDDSDKSLRFRVDEGSGSLAESMGREGQLAPIKVIAVGSVYRLIDGFRRSSAARELGWESIRAVIYPPMAASEARKISFIENVVRRRELTVLEKTNAIKQARREGYSKADIAQLFGISQRQIERYLAIPSALLGVIDGRRITMAHARTLAEHDHALSPEDIRALIRQIRDEGMTAAGLKSLLRERGIARSTGGRRQRQLGHISRDRVRVYNLDLSRAASPANREQTMDFLRRALQRIEEFGGGESTVENGLA